MKFPTRSLPGAAVAVSLTSCQIALALALIAPSVVAAKSEPIPDSAKVLSQNMGSSPASPFRLGAIELVPTIVILCLVVGAAKFVSKRFAGIENELFDLRQAPPREYDIHTDMVARQDGAQAARPASSGVITLAASRASWISLMVSVASASSQSSKTPETARLTGFEKTGPSNIPHTDLYDGHWMRRA
jgi:hypothetical protein